jgi:hypothetical protein
MSAMQKEKRSLIDTTLEIGKCYLIYVHDHYIGGGEIINCIVHGKLIAITQKKVVLCHWDVDSGDDEIVSLNREKTAIVKSTIYKIVELSPHRTTLL